MLKYPCGFWVFIMELGAQSNQPAGDFLDVGKIVAALGINEGMKIADFGCGSGYFTVLLGKYAGKNGTVYALDVQEPQLEAVKVRAKAQGLGNIEAIRSNLEVLGGSSLPNDSQDMVVMANVLFQSGKKADIIREGRRVLKIGGLMVVVEWRKGAGGFGLPDNYRLDEQTTRSILEDEGLKFERNIDAGQYHFGLAYRK